MFLFFKYKYLTSDHYWADSYRYINIRNVVTIAPRGDYFFVYYTDASGQGNSYEYVYPESCEIVSQILKR